MSEGHIIALKTGGNDVNIARLAILCSTYWYVSRVAWFWPLMLQNFWRLLYMNKRRKKTKKFTTACKDDYINYHTIKTEKK